MEFILCTVAGLFLCHSVLGDGRMSSYFCERLAATASVRPKKAIFLGHVARGRGSGKETSWSDIEE